MPGGWPLFWTEEKTAALTKLWNEGWSASEICRKIKARSRDAVIGKVWRLKLQRKRRSAPARPITKKPRPAVRSEVAPPLAPAPSISFTESDQTVPGMRPCSLLELKDGQCKWPIGDPKKPDFFFCGGKAVEGEVYCHGHMGMAYDGKPAVKKPWGWAA